MLQRAEGRDVEFGDAAEQEDDAITVLNPEVPEDVREAVGERCESAVGEVLICPILPEPANSGMVVARRRGGQSPRERC